VQVDPVKPKLKPRESKPLKLKCDVLLSTSAFKFSLRRYTEDCADGAARRVPRAALPRGGAVQVEVQHQNPC